MAAPPPPPTEGQSVQAGAKRYGGRAVYKRGIWMPFSWRYFVRSPSGSRSTGPPSVIVHDRHIAHSQAWIEVPGLMESGLVWTGDHEESNHQARAPNHFRCLGGLEAVALGARGAPGEAVHGADRPEREDAGFLRHAGPRAERAAPARLSGQRKEHPHHPDRIAETRHGRGCAQYQQWA